MSFIVKYNCDSIGLVYFLSDASFTFTLSFKKSDRH